MNAHRVSAMGDRALLVHCDGNDEARAVASALVAEITADNPADVIEDVVPAATSVLVVYTRPGSIAARAQAIARTVADAGGHEHEGSNEITTLETRYGGPDLELVARHAGLTRSAVVELHASVEYRVAFLGFVPGFAYLTGTPEQLRVPRRRDPRTSLPAGSVAVANDMTAVYPRSSPGGWQIIGSTQASLFDPVREPPSLLTVGTRVRFVPT